MEENCEKKEQDKFSLAATTSNYPLAIPPPLRKLEHSIHSFIDQGEFDSLDSPMYYNNSMEKMPQTTSREFMDCHNQEHKNNKTIHNVFKNFPPFVSGEFAMLFDNQKDMHPVP